METDIVVTTRNRLDYTKQCLTYIFERTRSPYNLHIIDDASTDGTVDYLLDLWHSGKVETVILASKKRGLRANQNMELSLTFSDPYISVDNDILCPDVEPDWLARGLKAIRQRSHLGLMGLHLPETPPEYRWKSDGVVCIAKSLGGHFAFIRRAAIAGYFAPHVKGMPVKAGKKTPYPGTGRCQWLQNHGWHTGFLIDTYCSHIGEVSARKEVKGKVYVMRPMDEKTLETTERQARVADRKRKGKR